MRGAGVKGVLSLAAALGLLAAGCLAPTASIPPPPSAPPPVHGTLTVAFVDVGQGDATVWQLPDGSIIVYDCGPPADNSSLNPVTGYLRSIGRLAGSKVWAVIASHGHLDHMGGCEEVLADYEVEHIYELWYDGPDTPNSYNRWVSQVVAENATVHTAVETPFLDDEQVFGQHDQLTLPPNATQAGLRAAILWPPPPHVSSWDEIGLFSVVIRWSFGAVDFCTAGDIERDQEVALASLPEDLNCEVFLVGHHGSAGSNSQEWLAKMGPKAAVVSFGENSYGHPTAQALCRLQSAGAKVFATERLGTVTATTDGSAFNLAPDAPEAKDYCAAGASYWPPAPPPSPPPPPPPAPPPAPANNTTTPPPLAITAEVSDDTPCQYTTVTVHVRATRGTAASAGASVDSTWRYKTSAPTESGTTDASGHVALSRYISGASAGYTVVVEVSAFEGGQSAAASTSFTPRAC